jgi:hypothetical protein
MHKVNIWKDVSEEIIVQSKPQIVVILADRSIDNTTPFQDSRNPAENSNSKYANNNVWD